MKTFFSLHSNCNLLVSFYSEKMTASLVFKRLRAFAMVIIYLLEPVGVGRKKAWIVSSMGVSLFDLKSKMFLVCCSGKMDLKLPLELTKVPYVWLNTLLEMVTLFFVL